MIGYLIFGGFCAFVALVGYMWGESNGYDRGNIHGEDMGYTTALEDVRLGRVNPSEPVSAEVDVTEVDLEEIA